jgi:integration host factor subunit beta
MAVIPSSAGTGRIERFANALAMTKSELIERITARQTQLSAKDVELAVKTIIEHMAQTLAHGYRIEIRGFGSFSLHYRAPRIGRNPKTGESVGLSGKYVPHFKPGKELRDRANESLVLFPMPAAPHDGEDDDG